MDRLNPPKLELEGIGWAGLGVRRAGLEESDPRVVENSSMSERVEVCAEPATDVGAPEEEIFPWRGEARKGDELLHKKDRRSWAALK